MRKISNAHGSKLQSYSSQTRCVHRAKIGEGDNELLGLIDS